MAANPNARVDTGAGRGAPRTMLDDALEDSFPASDPVAMVQPSRASPERPVVTQVTEARQGETGHNVRYVLIYGLIGIVIAFIVIYLVYNA